MMRDPVGWFTVDFTSFAVGLRSGPPATGLRKPESPKVPGRAPGIVPGKKGTAGGTAVSNAGRPLSLEK